jgi:GNAT superfamily N-acetyltransferase
MAPEIFIRPATLADVAELLLHRRGMYEAMGYTDATALAGMMKTSEPYLREAMTNGTLHAWVAENEGRVIGGGLVIVSPWLSHPYDQECRRATVLNMYVDPGFRRQGIARRLMQAMIAWCREQDFAGVALHASDQGRPLYESLGFEPTTEMRLKLR